MGDLRVLLLTALVEEHRALVELIFGSTATQQIDPELELTIGAATVHIVCLSSMGNVISSARTATLLATHRPQFVILSGIAGGVEGAKDYNLGDIVVAEQVILYEASKIRRNADGSQVAERRFWSYPAGAELLLLSRHLHIDIWPEAVSRRLTEERDNCTAPNIVFGPIASGEKVVANRDFLDSLLESYPLLKAIEMEGGGVAAAVHFSGLNCQCIVIKSVCDWADHRKNDGWHKYSSYASATFVKYLVNRIASRPRSDKVERAASAPDIQRHPDSSTTLGVFIDFLNPETQRIYGLDTKLDNDAKRQQALQVINAAMLLSEGGTIFPIGTLIETQYLLEMMADLMPFVSAGKLRFSMRENSVDAFLAKRRHQYRGQEAEYPNLFVEHDMLALGIPPAALVVKESHIGKRIAQTFSYGPSNLAEWQTLASNYSSQDLDKISQAPSMLLQDHRSITWPSLRTKLAELGIDANADVRRLLQVTYCKIYASEYGLEFLQNVDLAPYEIIPHAEHRRYDYEMLKRLLSINGVWEAVSLSPPQRTLALLESTNYRTFMSNYVKLCATPMSNEGVDAAIRNIKSHYHSQRRPKHLSATGNIESDLALALRKLKDDFSLGD